MLRMDINAKAVPVCKICDRKFGSFQILERHMKKKIPCNRVIKCDKCNKEFKQIGHLQRHIDRKTKCEPILGDPTIKVGSDTCIYCRRVFKNKYNVTMHYNVCKIKNGGMEILFEEVKRLKERVVTQDEQIKELQIKEMQIIQPAIQHIVNNTTNHFGHTFNFNFINFGEGDEIIHKILNKQGMELLEKKFAVDIPRIKQISDRVVNLIGLVFRNPDHKELQGIYVVDLSKVKENAYYHEDGNWKLTNWVTLRSQLLQKLYMCLATSKDNKRKDLEKIINYLFVLGNCGDCDLIKKLEPAETMEIYTEIGKQLKFETILY